MSLITFSAFRKEINTLVFPDGQAEVRVPLFRNFIVNGLIQLQTYVESYQLVNVNFYDKDQSWDDCGLSIIQGCRGRIGAVYAFKPSCRCNRHFYDSASLEKISCFYEHCRCHQTGSCCCGQSMFSAPSLYTANPYYCGDYVGGNTGCQPPYLQAEPEDDCAFKLSDKFFAVGPNQKIWLFPRFPCGYVLGVHWRGIRRSYLDTDYVPDDDDLKDAVAVYVESEVARRVDKDQVTADKLYADYRMKAGDIIFREEQDLKPRCTRVCVEGLDLSELVQIYPDNPYPTNVGEQCRIEVETPAVDPLLTSKLAVYYKFDELTSGTGDYAGFLRSADYLGACDLDTINSSGDPTLVTNGQIGNAVDFTLDHINIGLNSFTPALFTPTQKAKFNVYQQSFTMRFWMRLHEAGDGSSRFMELRPSYWNAIVDFPTNKIKFDLFGQTITSNEAIPIDGAFHRVIVSRDYAQSLISIKIDDNPTLTVAYTGTDVNPTVDFFFIGNTGYEWDVDEWGLWKDLAWTEAEMTYDWNNGAGKTLPFT